MNSGNTGSQVANTPNAQQAACFWKSRLLKFGLPLMIIVILANHLEYHFRHERMASQDVSKVTVTAEENRLAGHTTIGIDEKLLKDDKSSFLRFALLGEWGYDSKTPTVCPAQVQKLSGKGASCIGFMYPLEPGTMIKSFCLLRTTQTCCYGPRPQYNQYLLVEMKQPVKFERMKPVIVQGTFFVDPQPSQGYVYRMEGNSIVPVSDEGPDANPADESKKRGLPLFDFTCLSGIEGSKTREIPSELLLQDSKTVIVAGYFSNRMDGANPQVLVGSKYWDGASKGALPNVYNTVITHFKDAGQMPPLWKEKGIVKGILKVERNPELWRQNGIVSLQDAERLTGAGFNIGLNRGPILGIWEEALLVIGFLYVVVRQITSSTKPRKNDGVEQVSGL